MGKFVKLGRQINGANFRDLGLDHEAELLDLGTESQVLGLGFGFVLCNISDMMLTIYTVSQKKERRHLWQ